jgi:hypothetical protein
MPPARRLRTASVAACIGGPADARAGRRFSTPVAVLRAARIEFTPGEDAGGRIPPGPASTAQTVTSSGAPANSSTAWTHASGCSYCGR